MIQFLNSPTTVDEHKKAIQKLKCKKAAGVDGIYAEFYKYGCNDLLPFLPALELQLNTINNNGEYLSRWAGYWYTPLPCLQKGGPWCSR